MTSAVRSHHERLNHTLSLRPLIMGVLNATPDSFFEPSRINPEQILEKAENLIHAGADVIDLGGQSTRPGALPISESNERARVLPLITAISERFPETPLSIDTTRPAVAEAALEAGASILNDITGMRQPEMRSLAAHYEAGVVVMHMQGTPSTMQLKPQYQDVVSEVTDFLRGQAEQCEASGIPRQRIWIDPGFGFGKTTEHNQQLLERMSEWTALPYPVLVGLSRKRSIGDVLARKEPAALADPALRLEGSLALALYALSRGARIVRVHDVLETRRALDVFHWAGGGAS